MLAVAAAVWAAAAATDASGRRQSSRADDTRFTEWLRGCGDADSVELSHRVGRPRRIVAAADIAQGEPVLRLSPDCVVTPQTALERAEDAELEALKAVPGSRDRLAWWLLMERARGEESHFAPWLRVLPPRWEHPLLVDDKDVAYYEGPGVQAALRDARAAVNRAHEEQLPKLRRLLPQLMGTGDGPSLFSAGAFAWASAVVASHGRWTPESWDGGSYRRAREAGVDTDWAIVPGASFLLPAASVVPIAPNPLARGARLLSADAGATVKATAAVKAGEQVAVDPNAAGVDLLLSFGGAGTDGGAGGCIDLSIPKSRTNTQADTYCVAPDGPLPDGVQQAIARGLLTRRNQNCASKTTYKDLALCAGGVPFDFKVMRALESILNRFAASFTTTIEFDDQLLETGDLSRGAAAAVRHRRSLKAMASALSGIVRDRLAKARRNSVQLPGAERRGKGRRGRRTGAAGGGRRSGSRRAAMRRATAAMRRATEDHFDEL